MQQLEACRLNVQTCLQEVLRDLPVEIEVVTAPSRPTGKVYYELSSSLRNPEGHQTATVFGKVRISLKLSHESSEQQGKQLGDLFDKLRWRLDQARYQRVRIAKTVTVFHKELMTYGNAEVVVSFWAPLQAPFVFKISWISSVR